LATGRLAATDVLMPDVFFASFSRMLNFVSGLFLPLASLRLPRQRHGFAINTAV
jgi:hypothetical protein